MTTKRLNKKIKLNNDLEQKKLDSYFMLPKQSDRVAEKHEIQKQIHQQLDQPPSTPTPTPKVCPIRITETTTTIQDPGISFTDGEEGGKPQEEPLFYENSMYTDEFNVMLSTVLDGEKFLFKPSELDIFHIYQYKINGSNHFYELYIYFLIEK